MMHHIKPVFKHQASIDKKQFKQAKCLLTISVGQEVHEGDKFAATIDLVNTSFKSCIMLIDDSLQRHSMALDNKQEADDFYQESILAGDLWLQRNKIHYQRLTILEDTIRWDRWLNHPHYFRQQEKIKALINQEPDYKKAFDKTFCEFLRRYYLRLTEKEDFDWERSKRLCLDYLIEECTALSLWPELECQLEVYPSQRNLAMDATHQRLVIPSAPHLLHAVAIKFKNRKQLKSQQFHNITVIEEDR
jgi:hypothetical protein